MGEASLHRSSRRIERDTEAVVNDTSGAEGLKKANAPMKPAVINFRRQYSGRRGGGEERTANHKHPGTSMLSIP